MIMDIPRVGHGQILSLQKLPMAEMPLEACKVGLFAHCLPDRGNPAAILALGRGKDRMFTL